MRLPARRRRPSPDDVSAARVRVAEINRRSGWVPRVPNRTVTAPPATPRGRHARRERSVANGYGAADHAADVERGEVDGAAVDGSDVHAVRPHAGRPDYGPVAGAVADRLPLPIRALVEGLPAGIRHGQVELAPRHALVVAVVILLGLAATALFVGWGRPRVAAVTPGPAATVVATGTPVAATAGVADPGPGRPEIVVVHVAGKVDRPGIVELPAGSRVVDAIDAAGGLAGDVDLTTVNLARLLIDGEQLFVGVEPPPGVAAGAGQGGMPAGAAAGGAVNLNTATPEQLATLPGIGPALAARIVQWREQHGRFSAVEELLEVSGIGPAKFEALIGLVTL